MIVHIKGKLIEKKELSIVVSVQGLGYEVMVPLSVLQRIDQHIDENGMISLITFHYYQLEPSRGFPVLIGFLSEIERDFFLQFITVSGIGPRAAVRALNKPISEITRAIDTGDFSFLKTLHGIGMQRAKEIVAKLQGKVGRFGLIKDEGSIAPEISAPDWQEEALTVLLQLQYKRQEAADMIQKALAKSADIHNTEDLLNEIYKQRTKK